MNTVKNMYNMKCQLFSGLTQKYCEKPVKSNSVNSITALQFVVIRYNCVKIAAGSSFLKNRKNVKFEKSVVSQLSIQTPGSCPVKQDRPGSQLQTKVHKPEQIKGT